MCSVTSNFLRQSEKLCPVQRVQLAERPGSMEARDVFSRWWLGWSANYSHEIMILLQAVQTLPLKLHRDAWWRVQERPFRPGLPPLPGLQSRTTVKRKRFNVKEAPQSQRERFECVNCSIVHNGAKLETAQVAVSRCVK